MAEENKTTKPIEGKVASVITERELVINVGIENGVKIGMKFKVLADKPTEITDPDTGENLGSLDRDKVSVEAIEVQPRFSVCRTYKTRHIGAYYPELLSKIAVASREEVETLKTSGSSLLPPLSEAESYVKKGDRVVQITRSD